MSAKAVMFLRYNAQLEENGVKPLQRTDTIFDTFFSSDIDFSIILGVAERLSPGILSDMSRELTEMFSGFPIASKVY